MTRRWNSHKFLVVLQFIFSCTAFDVVQDYSGSKFFDKWDFYGNYDNLTSGDVLWQDRANATSERLAFVNSAGNAIIKVDNTTNVPYLIKRDTVRITTQQSFGIGSLWIADFVHLPYGCSVWPAFWTKGPHWPLDGEIDIIEGVNLMDHNQMALHTRSGCTHAPPPTQRGTSGVLDCSQDAGCTVAETATGSFGEAFAKAGGGVFATQFNMTGVYLWFWSRSDIPQSILASTSTSSIASLDDWGPPSASYPSINSQNTTVCDIPTFFGPQSLVLDITLCGNWAGVPSVYTPQCASQGPTGLCYNDNVIGSGANYANAYFEIKYIRAYTAPGTPAASSTAASPTASGSNDTKHDSSSDTIRFEGLGGLGIWFSLVIPLALIAWG